MRDPEPTGVTTSETNEYYLTEAEKSLVRGFFGDIKLSLENGRIVYVKIERTMRLAASPERAPADEQRNARGLTAVKGLIAPGFFGRIILSASNGTLERYEVQQVFKVR